MSYEEKYKEAIESIKRIYDQADSYGRELMEKEFHELKESEDERIRKTVLKMITDMDGGYPFEKYGIIKKNAIAWLEKQGEKPVVWSEEDEKMLDSIIECLDGTGLLDFDQIDWLKSIKPNHWKPSEEQMEALFEAKLASIKNREYFLGLLYEDLKKL